MKKKLLTLMLSVAVLASSVSGCGGSDDAANESTAAEAQAPASDTAATDDSAAAEEDSTEQTSETEEPEEETAAEADSGSESDDWSLLDVSEDMITVGAYGSDEDGTELVFSMFTGPDGNDYVSLFGFDNNSGDGDVICGTYEASTEVDEDGDNWTYFNVSDVYTGNDFQLGVAERPSTEEVLFFDADGNVVEGSYLTASETIDYMGSAVAVLSEAEAEGSSDEEDVIAQLKSVLTLGYAGASEAGEELYFACDEDVDLGILGIVENGDALFLAGDITEDEDQVLTITDDSTGDSLSFTVEQVVDDEGTECLLLTVVSNESSALLYAADASEVIDEMNQY